jgi:hypothetical protein
LDEVLAEKAELARRLAHRGKEKASDLVQAQVDSMVGGAVDRIVRRVKNEVKDEDMPRVLLAAIDDFVDNDVAPELKKEASGMALQRVRRPIRPEDNPPSPWWRALRNSRRWLVYKLFPYDRSLWRQTRDPLWWLLHLLLVFPRYGVSSLAWIVVFLCIDKGDEYSLVSFLLSFKQLHFFGLGLVPLFYGAVLYYVCFCHAGPGVCQRYGPFLLPWEACLFALQALLSLSVGVLLGRSKQKGRYLYRNELKSEAEATGGRRGGRLRMWILFDLLNLLVCLALFCTAVALRDPAVVRSARGFFVTPSALVKMDLFWARTLYGLLSLPFLLFELPFLTRLLTHAPRSGYTRNGKVVPFLSNEKKRALKEGRQIFDDPAEPEA